MLIHHTMLFINVFAWAVYRPFTNDTILLRTFAICFSTHIIRHNTNKIVIIENILEMYSNAHNFSLLLFLHLKYSYPSQIFICYFGIGMLLNSIFVMSKIFEIPSVCRIHHEWTNGDVVQMKKGFSTYFVMYGCICIHRSNKVTGEPFYHDTNTAQTHTPV